jgi:PAS domain S-box-containing protein
VDITERKETEEAVRAAERLFRHLATMAPVGIIQTDAQGLCLFVNDQWCRLTGLSAEASRGDGWRAALHPEDRARIDAAWEEAVRTGQEFAADHRFLRPSGEVRWSSARAVALHDAQGRVTGYLASAMDITDRYQAEKQVRAALHEKETLLKEVHHRVKNNMAVIASLLGMQAARAADTEAASILQECRNRVHAMAAIHEELYQSGDLAHIDLGPYVQRLCAELERSSGGPAGQVHARVCVPPLPVDLETAVPLGLIVNELVTNAFKHAFPAGRGGEVVVRLAAEAGDRVTLTVQDDGVGLPAGLDPGRARSLGLRLVHSLARQLRAQVALENGTGTTVRLTFPLPGPGREES